ncbi:MAG: hypothetical protein H7A38_02225 [Chlamydiales bacterium]|nr:hypothetical protein [Chlamydiales bacterium]
MKISHLLANHIHHVMVGAVVTTDLWTDATNQNYSDGFRKIRNIAILLFAQHYLKKMIPALSPSSRVMMGIACYERVRCRESSQYQALLVSAITAAVALSSLGLREHGILDLLVAGVAGKVFGILWNYSFS